MKVATVKEAWELADRLFPTDYEHDEQGSKKAGYPIYMSTLKGSNAHISDLNTRLELNYDDRASENIWIEEKMEKDNVAVVGTYVEKNGIWRSQGERNKRSYLPPCSGNGK